MQIQYFKPESSEKEERKGNECGREKKKKKKKKSRGEKIWIENRVLGIEPGIFSLDDHYFDHQAEVFQALFCMEN